MKSKQLLLGIVVVAGLGLAAVSANAAPSAKFIGTWNLDLAGMPASPPPPKSVTLITSDAGGGKWKSTVETVGADGKTTKSEVTYAVDGKDYPVTGDPTIDANAFTSPDSNTLVIAEKKGGRAKPPEVELVEGTARRQDGAIAVDGKVKNSGDKSIKRLVLLFRFLDPSQNTVAVRKDEIESVMEPGDTAEFHSQVPEPPGATHFQVEFEDGRGRVLRAAQTEPTAIQ